MLDIGARGGEQTLEALYANFSRVIAIECQADEWYRLRGVWRAVPEVELLHVCASNAEMVQTLYNAEGATSLGCPPRKETLALPSGRDGGTPAIRIQVRIKVGNGTRRCLAGHAPTMAVGWGVESAPIAARCLGSAPACSRNPLAAAAWKRQPYLPTAGLPR